MIKVALCDDETFMLNQMSEIIEESFEKNNFECELFCYNSGDEMLKEHKVKSFDIIFLDILMPDKNGFDVAKEVRCISDKTLILFVTSQDELVYDSFDYHPFYFLRKGDSNTFSESLSCSVKKIADFIKRNQYISLNLNSGESQIICMQDIIYIESNRNFDYYHLKSGKYIPVREKISTAEEKLETSGFVRIHKRYIVNMNKIQKITMSRSPEITLVTSEILPIGKKYRQSTEEKYRNFLRIII